MGDQPKTVTSLTSMITRNIHPVHLSKKLILKDGNTNLLKLTRKEELTDMESGGTPTPYISESLRMETGLRAKSTSYRQMALTLSSK